MPSQAQHVQKEAGAADSFAVSPVDMGDHYPGEHQAVRTRVTHASNQGGRGSGLWSWDPCKHPTGPRNQPG